MMNHRNNNGSCRGRMGMRRDALWGAYGTYPTQPRQGVGQCQRQPRTGDACPLPAVEQRSRNNGCGCGVARRNEERAVTQNSGCGCGNSHARGNGCGNTHVHGNGCGNSHAHGNGCGDCNKLLQQIRVVDFALYEVVLYLDVYPTSCEALETYHKLMARRKALYAEYETACGPITATGNESHTSWDWIEKPFPWENSAN